MTEKVFTLPEIAKMLKVSRKTSLIWVNNGTIKAVKIAHQWRITESEYNRLIGQNKGKEEKA